MESILTGLNEIGTVFSGVTSPLKPQLTFTPDRRNIWKGIVNRMAEERLPVPCYAEKVKLKRLSTGTRWKDMVDPDWREIYGAIYDESSSFTVPESEVMKIEKDVHRTFSLFTRNISNIKITSTLEKSLQSILVAASHECGYCQGINFLAALFLIGERDERDAFILLRFLLRHRHLENLFNAKCSSLLEYMNVFSKRFRKNNKAVYTHLKTVGFGPVCYAIEWFTTCFITTCPGDLSACVLDLMLLGFDDIMLRVGLAVMDVLQTDLLALDLEELQMDFKGLVTALAPIDVLPRALSLCSPASITSTPNVLFRMSRNIERMNPLHELVGTLHRYKASLRQTLLCLRQEEPNPP